jgi:hypothetical protein
MPIRGNRDGSVDALADGAIGLVSIPPIRQELVRAIGDALAGRGPIPRGGRRFAVENFTQQICALTNSQPSRRTDGCMSGSSNKAATRAEMPAASIALVIGPGMTANNYWRDLWRYRELVYFLAGVTSRCSPSAAPGR